MALNENQMGQILWHLDYGAGECAIFFEDMWSRIRWFHIGSV